MIKFTNGNILTADAEALVNTVNCVGIMGRGIALQFKNKFPNNFKAYVAACKRQEVLPGKMFVFDTGALVFPRYIINFPTKRHWKGKSRMEDIDSGLEDLARVIEEKHIKSIALPPLGSGLGGLDWHEVRSRIENALSFSSAQVLVFEPSGAPQNDVMSHAKKIPSMTAGRAALIGLMHCYLKGLLDPFLTLLEIHKLMYFLQESGEPLNLSYGKALYGPYANNLRHVLNAVEGYYISGYADGGDDPNKHLELVPGAIQEAKSFLQTSPETSRRFEQISDLVNGFETSFGLELLSTVHWVISKDNARNLEDAIRYTYEWSKHKRQFSERQIRLAAKRLADKGWLSAFPFV
ncbi:MAG: macro domain-containing protein [Fibromonadaceae bacterium]|jgi:O-acetyl-ADP-ribose deacetylase (regulator of RNase III)|nr:macro domain-containing protein [Fibromonadaceae bacterium]